MAYIVRSSLSSHSDRHFILYSQISVNAAIVSDTGGTCVCPTDDLCNNDATYLACVDEIRRELVTSTAAVSALASTLMGIFANLPVGLAPGLGLNAYVSAPRRCMISSLISSSSPTLSSGIMAVAERLMERRWPRSSWKAGSFSSYPSSACVSGWPA
jgi:hypothetical protein